MPTVPADALRALLADRPREAVVAFVADLWRARGFDVERDGDHLRADGRPLRVAETASDPAAPPADGWLVTATPPPDDAPARVVGPAGLHELLLYDVERDAAAELFEAHFDRPLDDDWSDLQEWSLPGSGRGSAAAPHEGPAPGRPEDAETATPGGGPTATVRERVPSTPADLRRVLLDRRVLAATLVLLVVAGPAAWGLFGHQPAPAERADPPFARNQPAPAQGSYRVVGQVAGSGPEGSFFFERTRTYAPGDPPVELSRWTFGDTGDRVTVVAFQRGEHRLSRQSYTNASRFERYVFARRADADLVRADRTTRTLYLFEPNREPPERAPGASFTTSTLARLPYERVGEVTYHGADVAQYAPTTGWILATNGSGELSPRYVRTASGTVLVDPDTGVLLRANVTVTLVRARTWGDALTRPGETLTVSYEVDTDVEPPTAPPWVDAVEPGARRVNATD